MKKNAKRALSLLMVLTMLLGIVPTSVWAVGEEEALQDTAASYTDSNSLQEDEGTIDDEDTDEESDLIPAGAFDMEDESLQNAAGEVLDSISEWADFLAALQVLEGYAETYVESNSAEDATGLMINYIRTGVERYTTDSWETIAGAENTAFVAYVLQQDEENGTGASALRNLEDITLPNGNTMDIGHLFGCLNVASSNSYNENYADFGSWLGDICDLMLCANYYGTTSTNLEELVAEIAETYFLDNYKALENIESDISTFSLEDLRADLDSFYIVSMITCGSTSLCEILDSYYTDSLTDTQRAAYFLNNRFGGSTTKDSIREVIYAAYSSHLLAKTLEAGRGLSDLDTLRTACCYVLADYLYELADGYLVEGDEEEEQDDSEDEGKESTAFTVFSSSTTTLAPGVTQTISYALDSNSDQIVYYYATVDITRDDVAVYANYNENDGSSWAMSSVSDQMLAAEAKHSDESDTENYIENYSAVVGVNADFYNMSTGAPSGVLVMEGVTYHGVGSENFFAILEDGTAVIGTNSQWSTYADRVAEAVGGSTILVSNGENTQSESNTAKSPRTAVGITADGQVVLIVVDGRQSPYSAGASAYEMAEIMISVGCVTALMLDGGGSTTFDAKQEGSDEITVVNRPCDSYERAVSSSLMVVSTAYTSTEFDHALLTTDTDYLTINSVLEVEVTGVSSTGNAAEIPEGAYLTVSDETVGTIEGTTFTAVGVGSVTISLVVDGEVAGTKTVTVIRRPDTLIFTQERINAIYGEATELPLTATYQSNPVTINSGDITFTFSTATAGVMDGFAFIGDESSGVRKVTITAQVTTNPLVDASMMVYLYTSDESTFDFDTAMYGDESLAWNREVSNTVTLDQDTYYIIDVDADTVASYTFALDIQAIEAPDSLAPLMAYLSGFAGTSSDAKPWDYLLALAARVNTQTNVTISVTIDEGVDVDISNISVVNDYFKLTSAEFDEDTRVLTVICNWVEQDSAIASDTADSVCVLSGVVLIPNDTAAVDQNNCIQVGMTGSVSYDIYLRSSQLYSLASIESNQSDYGIYPYYDPTDSDGAYGGHFSDQYITFTDSFSICQEALDGWVSNEDQLFYYRNNVAVTGIQYVPSYGDSSTSLFYHFDSNGVCLGTVTGLIDLTEEDAASTLGTGIVYSESTGCYYYYVDGVQKYGLQYIDGYYYYFRTSNGAAIVGRTYWITVTNDLDVAARTYTFDEYGRIVELMPEEDDAETGTIAAGIYYAIAGEIMTGWRMVGEDYYYFDPSTGAAVNGSQTIDGYTYTFTNYILTRGALVSDSGGIHYKWAGEWVRNCWVEIDGNKYFAQKVTQGYFLTDLHTYVYAYGSTTEKVCCLFDENGVWLEDYTGLYTDTDGSIYMIRNGVMDGGAGLVYLDGYYYYFRTSTGAAVVGRSYWITVTNDLLPEATYTFDEYGRMINPPVTETTDPEDSGDSSDPEEPDTPEDPDESEVSPYSIVEVNGSYYCYLNGVQQYGLQYIDGYYYYFRTSNGAAVVDRTYWITVTNGLDLEAKTYTFDACGRIVL